LAGVKGTTPVEKSAWRKKPGHRIVPDPLARKTRACVRSYDRKPAKPAFRR
jgi:hypothetical protein